MKTHLLKKLNLQKKKLNFKIFGTFISNTQ